MDIIAKNNIIPSYRVKVCGKSCNHEEILSIRNECSESIEIGIIDLCAKFDPNTDHLNLKSKIDGF